MPRKIDASRAGAELVSNRWSKEIPDPEYFRKIAKISWEKRRKAKNKKTPSSESEQ